MVDVRILTLGAMALLMAAYGASQVGGGSVSIPKSSIVVQDRVLPDPTASDTARADANSLDPMATGSVAGSGQGDLHGSIRKSDRGVYVDGYHLHP